MTGASIAAEVAAALAEAAGAVGNGAQALLIRPAPEPTLPAGQQQQNPWDDLPDPPDPPQPQPVWAIAEAYRQDLVDGTLIRAEDRRVMIEAVTPAPTTADHLSIGGVEYGIVRVDPEAPAGVPLMFTCQCRK